jgi:hypothetical protein
VKPWGKTIAPVFFDSKTDSSLMTEYEKGVWYYSSISLTDHHDFAGMESK